MYSTISLITLVGTVAGIALHFYLSGSAAGAQSWFAGVTEGTLRKLIYFVMLFSFAVLTVTGLYPSLAKGQSMSGYLLMVHATFAPVFAVSLMLVTLMFAHVHKFGPDDWCLRTGSQRKPSEKLTSPKDSNLGVKIWFWLMILFSVPVLLSVLLGMYPITSMTENEFLLQVHKYCALPLVACTVVHAYWMFVSRSR